MEEGEDPQGEVRRHERLLCHGKLRWVQRKDCLSSTTRTRLFEAEGAAGLKGNKPEGEEKAEVAMEVWVREEGRERNSGGCKRRGLVMLARIAGGNQGIALMKLG